MLAEDLASEIEEGNAIEVTAIEDLEPSNFDPALFYVFITSTYGEGELPETGKFFVERLKNDAPDLSDIRFGIFGLGDTSYATFNQGSQRLLEALLDRNGTFVGERGLHDAASGELPEAQAIPWIKSLLALEV